MSRTAKVLAIIGPSGVGKSTLVRELAEIMPIQIIPTWTDRPKRAGETAFEHMFVRPDEFDNLIDEKFFSEVVQPFSLPYRYGFSRQSLEFRPGYVPLIMIRQQFVDIFKKYFPNHVIYQITTDKQTAERQLLERQADAIGSRLNEFNDELRKGTVLAHRTFNNMPGKLDEILTAIKEAIDKDFER